MICRVRGVVREHADTHILLDIHGLCYQVFVPPSIMRALAERCAPEAELELVTFHYQQLEVGRGVPVLIGFANEIEREFFERFITVAGIGPKGALKAFTLPIPAIAKAIDEGNVTVLKSLPGIGEQRAKEVIAKLQGKVGKYALMPTKDEGEPGAAAPAAPALEDEAIAILLQLEYSKHEAKEMVRVALARNPRIKSSEELLNEVYRQRLQEQPVAVS